MNEGYKNNLFHKSFIEKTASCFVDVLGMYELYTFVYTYQLSSVPQLCLTLCNAMDCSMLGLPVLHQLPELAQTQVHQVGDAIQLFQPLSSPSPPTFNLSQDQGLF